MAIPTWLKTHLQREGLMDTNGLTRAVRARRCTRCHAHILAGLDADLCAMTAHVDPTPLSQLGETAALILGRRTYGLWFSAGRYELTPRDHWAIKGHPAGHPDNQFDVHAEHICGSGPLPAAPSIHERLHPTRLAPGAPAPF